MTIIDTHAHLYLPEFKDDIDQVISRARAEGVTKMFLPAIDAEYTSLMVDLENKYPGTCISMMGLHPCSVKENYGEELNLVEQLLKQRKFAAIGEIGLDFYWDKTFIKQQYLAFEKQIMWALDYELPIVIHSREAGNECLEVVKKHHNGSLRGIFHCFSGDLKLANGIIDSGFLLGIGGVLTYKNSGLANILKDISLEHLVLETDAPYLTPVPFRGKRNESSYLKYVVEKLAQVKDVSIEEVAEQTTANAQKIFG